MLRESDHADFQADFAMVIAKKQGVPPRDVAKVADALGAGDAGLEMDVSGPGFLNVTVSDSSILDSIGAMLTGRSMGVPLAPKIATVVVDYSAPNGRRRRGIRRPCGRRGPPKRPDRPTRQWWCRHCR